MTTKTQTFEYPLVWTGPTTRALASLGECVCVCVGGGGGGAPWPALRVSSDMSCLVLNDRMGVKIKPPKNPQGLKHTPSPAIPQKSLDQNLTIKKSHAKFPSHKHFQKALNDTTRKTETLVMEVCVCLSITSSGVRTFFAYGGHCNNVRDTQEHILLTGFI